MEQFQSKILDRSKSDDRHAREEYGDDEEYTSDIDYEAGKGVIGINDKFRLYQHHQYISPVQSYKIHYFASNQQVM